MNDREGLRRIAAQSAMAITEPVLRFPLPLENNTEFMTPTEKLFVLAHLGVPRIDIDSWTCQVAGLVRSPRSLRFPALSQFQTRTVQTFFQCAGNPLNPTHAARLIANLEWRGVLLRDILAHAGLASRCKYIWAFGLDSGTFFGSPRQEHYVKDLPIDYVMTHDVLVATHLNGELLSPEHGFPARIVAPGYYGTNSVKWLCRVEAADRRADAYFTKELYNDSVPGGAPKPVWEIEPESIIVRPESGSTANAADLVISGWAWSSAEIELVEVSTDGGGSWNAAHIEPRVARSWQRFTFPWTPVSEGRFELLSRVTDSAGRRQPLEGARNSVHRIQCTVAV
jgi:DMSO/TMAO reductase YedYZ molybdopterin-dependent catalytic subunit